MAELTTSPATTLNDGTTIPQLGFGVWQIPDDQAFDAVSTALQVGYRHIDTAKIYGNEVGVGRAVAESGIAREDIYITTKLWNDDQGYDSTLAAFDASMERLGLDYLDLYLIHWQQLDRGKWLDTWKAFQQIKKDGRVRSIGVSNFTPATLEKLIAESGEAPVLNQVELHPRLQQTELRAFHAQHDIATQAWSPLGQGTLLDNEVLTDIASAHGASAAQVVIRWHLQLGNVVIPKSATPSRIASNFDVFGFTLSDGEMAAIAALDSVDGRVGPHPDEFSS